MGRGGKARLNNETYRNSGAGQVINVVVHGGMWCGEIPHREQCQPQVSYEGIRWDFRKRTNAFFQLVREVGLLLCYVIAVYVAWYSVA